MFNPGEGFGSSIDFAVLNYYLPESERYRNTLIEHDPDPDLRAKLDAVVDVLVGGTQKLAGADIAPLWEIAQTLNAISGPDLPRDSRWLYLLTATDARVAEDVVGLARSAQSRFQDLFILMQRTRLSAPATRFLRRVSRCYLYGFDVECAIMCRSALDAEFQAEIPSDDCLANGSRRTTRDGEPAFNLCERINAAGQTGRLDAESVEMAHEIRLQTNQLIHRNPRPPENLGGIVAKTIRVISALNRE
jgi:hypothetical protein